MCFCLLLFSFFFFLMIRRPPRSTPFPTRRSSDLCFVAGSEFVAKFGIVALSVPRRCDRAEVSIEPVRSEEHTSELQSLRHLVCRLLLEKKNKNKNEIKEVHTTIYYNRIVEPKHTT